MVATLPNGKLETAAAIPGRPGRVISGRLISG